MDLRVRHWDGIVGSVALAGAAAPPVLLALTARVRCSYGWCCRKDRVLARLTLGLHHLGGGRSSTLRLQRSSLPRDTCGRSHPGPDIHSVVADGITAW
jgi:hypothetical protein